jgi:hypothetical protein
VEEARQDIADVLRRRDLRQLDDAREADPPVPERLHDLGAPLDELGRDLPVLRRPLRDAELPVEEVEEARVTQRLPQPLAVEGGERDEEVGERRVLAAEEGGQLIGAFACDRDERIVSRGFDPS